ncbi:MAG: Bifunctional (p)ppGpp synthase/hydrolase relA [Deltaproteobacteria bacterium ADurb.Bin151]|nr:MAG: Bifunctional (p)ppGpp synthase/hydrolase relA [Deltaproteobacteria bacterium ADurb.Bin151]HNZ10841.1 HD domain-containing protein [Smithellaceae bacterium]HOG81160.1 HD domain-containing protein [Smithellaceae bacterium]HOQ41919.1 HD domain-containing protein [Smithellaceae bacterium]HPL65891.1 HD domain-containing protein [Smithellaceae bacterium]
MKNDLAFLLKALYFSAQKHRHQRRKDTAASPFINHPIEVAHLLWTVGEVSDATTITAAILHDTIEDTDTTCEEISMQFGNEVLGLVLEVSDDKNLPKQERKRKQIVHSPHLSRKAKLIKLADKISNVHDIAFAPPDHWSLQRRIEYLQWAEDVVAGLRGINKNLEKHFDETLAAARQRLNEENKENP